MYARYVKRVLDIIISAALLILLALPFAFIAVIIRLDSKGKVFFLQKRRGLGGREFTIIKFRTMKTDAPRETATHLLKSSAYITRVGRYLRVSSVDELPQIINILKGDMSFVGFRPCILSEEELHEARISSGAYAVRPGITGLAQIRGRDLLDDTRKAQYDGIYARNVSFGYDFRILMRTFFTVFAKDGYKEGEMQ